jgi:release factor glutamine methyltransferase
MKGPTYQEYLEGTAEVLRRSESEQNKYEIQILGLRFVVYPGVFSPKYFLDTGFFVSHLPWRAGEEFLEIGPGTGVISVFAALKGAASVTAIDINPLAVKNTQKNAEIHRVSKIVKVMQGDVYEPLKEDVRFDTIFWNTPFGYVENYDLTALEKAVFDPGYQATHRFIGQAVKHLKENGRLLIGFSTTLGKFEILQEFLLKRGFNIRLIAKTESLEIHPVSFEIFEATLKSQR